VANLLYMRTNPGSKVKVRIHEESNMKTIIAAGTSVFLIVTLLLSLPLVSSVSAAGEDAFITASIIEARGDMKNIQVGAVRNSGAWALVMHTYDDENWGARGASALLKKAGTSWQFMQSSGKTPTTDLLKQNNVPSNYWRDLIDDASISKTKPVLAFLHSKYPRQSFESVEISGDYALATWYGGEDSGMTLLRKSGNSWKVILSTGGVIDADTMRRYSVPEQHIGPLLGLM